MREKYVIALGTFDGLHPGHRAVLNTCLELAKELGARPMVYTFTENPRVLFGSAPRPLMTLEEKIAAMKSLGIGRVEAVPFTKELAALPPEEFVERLISAYNPAGFVCGEDYTFGCRAAGTSGMLKQLAAEENIETRIVPTVTVEGTAQKISSTLIRKALDRGDNALAQSLLRGREL